MFPVTIYRPRKRDGVLWKVKTIPAEEKAYGGGVMRKVYKYVCPFCKKEVKIGGHSPCHDVKRCLKIMNK